MATLTQSVLSAMRNHRRYLIALLLPLLFMGANAALATSVREATVAEMADKSAVIFEGVVVDVRAHKTEHGSIVTAVVFEVLDVIKGSLPQRRLTLEFLGGEIPGERQSIAAMQYPQLGEQGIYFAESIDQPLINPLYGWDQGRFLVQRDHGGVERVLTAGKRPVMDVQGSESTFFATPGVAVKLSTGVANGVRATPAASANEGLSTGQFKQRIRNLLGAPP
ncbi:MAG: hypothetical protein HZB57_03005 [Gammaproteobacteria bacterium]|nr:hypothetical protein [Gammaproteobacteria bacterium]